MPYTPKQFRKQVLEKGIYVTAGDLAFHVSHVIEQYRQQKGDGYQTFADIDAALHGAAHEFKRKVVDPYEDEKLVLNGPVHQPGRVDDPGHRAPACSTGDCA